MSETQPDLGAILARSASPARFTRSLWFGGVVLVLLVVVTAWLWPRKEPQGPRFLTEPARRGDLVIEVTATGTLAPTTQVDVGLEVSGTIREVLVDYNDRVRAGQVLARLDTTKLEAQRAQTLAALEAARARVSLAEATLSEAEDQLARLRHVAELSGGRVPSERELVSGEAAVRRARADLANARAAVVQSEAQLHANETDLAKAVVRAPIDGVVLKRSVDPGQTFAANFQTPVLFTIAQDLRKMQLQVDVDEADVGQVRPGQAARFTVDAWPEREFAARVEQVRLGAQTISGVVTYKTVLSVDNSDLALRPGMTATAQITVAERHGVLLVPNAALRFVPPAKVAAEGGPGLVASLLPRPPHVTSRLPAEERAGHRVWIMENGRPKAIAVKIGGSDGRYTEILDGALREGQQLLVDVMPAPR